MQQYSYLQQAQKTTATLPPQVKNGSEECEWLGFLGTGQENLAF